MEAPPHISTSVQKASAASQRKRKMKLELRIDSSEDLRNTISSSDDDTKTTKIKNHHPIALVNLLHPFRKETKKGNNGTESAPHDGPANLSRDCTAFATLGKGAGGVVYLGLYRPLLKLVAIKQVSVSDKEEQAMIAHELHALHSNMVPIDPKHAHMKWPFHFHSHIGGVHPCPNIVSFYGAYTKEETSQVCIVMEYMSAGSLQDLLGDTKVLSEDVIRHIAKSACLALVHMHSAR